MPKSTLSLNPVKKYNTISHLLQLQNMSILPVDFVIRIGVQENCILGKLWKKFPLFFDILKIPTHSSNLLPKLRI